MPDDAAIGGAQGVGDAVIPAVSLQALSLLPRIRLSGEWDVTLRAIDVHRQRPRTGALVHAAGSRRTTMDFDVGVPLLSAVLSSGTSTFVSG
jgi:hypothetical protein